MCGHMIQVLVLQRGEAVVFDICQIVAGDKMETPGAELACVVKLSIEQQSCMYMREYN